MDTSTNGADTVEPERKAPEMVPASRLAEVVGERNALRKELAAAKSELGEVGEWRAAAEKERAAIAAERVTHAEDRDLYRAGLMDPEAHIVARALFAALPTEGRPATLGAYLSALLADGATVPKALAGYLAPPSSAAKAVTTTTTPKPPASAGQPTPTGATLTAEAFAAAREHYKRTGDMEPMRRLEAARKAARTGA
jgi:hypothetical protein